MYREDFLKSTTIAGVAALLDVPEVFAQSRQEALVVISEIGRGFIHFVASCSKRPLSPPGSVGLLTLKIKISSRAEPEAAASRGLSRD
jgi:hypothetical protein